MRRSAGLATVVVVLSAAGTANAGIEKLSEVAWWAAYGGTAENGEKICALVTVAPNDQSSKLVIDYAAGSDTFRVRMLKPSWNIPPETSGTVRVQFGYNSPWVLSTQAGGTEVRASLPAAQLQEFLSGFRRAGSISVKFFAGREAPWRLATGGQGFVEPDFLRCLKMLVPEKSITPTQPF